jgi:hypothetical protein
MELTWKVIESFQLSQKAQVSTNGRASGSTLGFGSEGKARLARGIKHIETRLTLALEPQGPATIGENGVMGDVIVHAMPTIGSSLP